MYLGDMKPDLKFCYKDEELILAHLILTHQVIFFHCKSHQA